MTSDQSHRETRDQGLAMRRQVLGEDHVERSLNEASEFARPMQDFVTEYCWGAVWTRPGLSPKIRSMLNLAMLTAVNRNHEFALHVRGALRNGVTGAEVREILLQAAVYVGAPAALESFRIAERAIAEHESEPA